jgi:integrase
LVPSKYNTCLKHLQAFRPAISFGDIDENLMQGFFQYLHKTLGLEGASIKKYFSALKKVIKTARRDSHKDASSIEFLYADVKITVKPSMRRVFLELDEIRKWKALDIPKNKTYLQRDRDMFLFQIYTGYYYKDLRIFRKDQLMNDEEHGMFILGERDKNGKDTIIPLFKFPYANVIMDRYAADLSSEFVFGPDAFIEEPVYNRNLKELAKMAGINKTVYNKVGRHTNAQLYVRFGAKTSIVSKMLGHTKEETTRHYFKVNIPEIVEGTKNIDFVKMGI